MAKHSSDKQLKVSVLMPIYNVEKFLPECMDSLINQTLKEIEIICINDGSKDNSLSIVKEYAKKNKNIIIIDKENTGYGDSMNRGLREAIGEYVGIVEPDDFVELNAFEELYEVANKSKAEVVKANFYEYMTKEKRDMYKSSLFLENEVGKVIDTGKNRHIFYQQPSIWSAIYKRDFLLKNGINFLPSVGASYQDAGFNFKVFAMARRVCFVDKAYLHYRQDNPNSSVKSDGKVYAVKNEYDDVEEYLKARNLMDTFGSTLAIVRMGGYIWNMRRLTKKAALDFAKTVRSDYARYKRAGYLEVDGLEKDAEFIVKNLAIRDPEKFVKTRFFYELNDKTKTKLFRMYNKIKRRNNEKV